MKKKNVNMFFNIAFFVHSGIAVKYYLPIKRVQDQQLHFYLNHFVQNYVVIKCHLTSF